MRKKWEPLSDDKMSAESIRVAYDVLYWKDFIATIAGWRVSCRRVSRILGKKIGQRYRISWAYDKSFCTR